MSKTYRNERKTRSWHCDQRSNRKYIVLTYHGSDLFPLVPFPFSSAGNRRSLLRSWFPSNLLNATGTLDLYNVLSHGIVMLAIESVTMSVARETGATEHTKQ